MSTLTTLPRRPDAGGKSGKQIEVKTNFFKVSSLSQQPVHHYDIAITPDAPPVKNRRIWAQMELQIQKANPKAFLAYDGAKNAFGIADVPDSTYVVHIIKDPVVTIPDIPKSQPSSAGRGGRGGGRGGRGGGRGGSSQMNARAPVMTWKPAGICIA